MHIDIYTCTPRMYVHHTTLRLCYLAVSLHVLNISLLYVIIFTQSGELSLSYGTHTQHGAYNVNVNVCSAACCLLYCERENFLLRARYWEREISKCFSNPVWLLASDWRSLENSKSATTTTQAISVFLISPFAIAACVCITAQLNDRHTERSAETSYVFYACTLARFRVRG